MGDPDPQTIWAAVGRASSEWEHAEVILARLFQFFSETPSFAASRVYGTPTAFVGRLKLVELSSEEFFLRRLETSENVDFQSDTKALLKAFSQASKERNKIVHAMVQGMHLRDYGNKHTGYYLTPSYYSTNKRNFDMVEGWPLGADYFFRSQEIIQCASRFSELMKEGMILWLALIKHYGVPEGTQFVPRERAPDRR